MLHPIWPGQGKRELENPPLGCTFFAHVFIPICFFAKGAAATGMGWSDAELLCDEGLVLPKGAK